jgi:hypothetical protein
MALQLASDEPEAGPWRAEPLTAVVATVMQPGQGKGGQPVVLAVDGRSSSGKTTLAGRLRHVVAGSAVVRTDDIAWWHSRFGWADLLVDGVFGPLTERHYRDWMAEEILFVAAQRPWDRADLITCGTPEIPFDPATELVIAHPRRT